MNKNKEMWLGLGNAIADLIEERCNIELDETDRTDIQALIETHSLPIKRGK